VQHNGFSFHKEERLTSQLIIEQLFAQNSKGIFKFPFRVSILFTELPGTFPAQVLISVSSRRFKRAHDRNRIKRQIREIYRLCKNDLYTILQSNNKQAAILITYVGKTLLPYHQLDMPLREVLSKLVTPHAK